MLFLALFPKTGLCYDLKQLQCSQIVFQLQRYDHLTHMFYPAVSPSLFVVSGSAIANGYHPLFAVDYQGVAVKRSRELPNNLTPTSPTLGSLDSRRRDEDGIKSSVGVVGKRVVGGVIMLTPRCAVPRQKHGSIASRCPMIIKSRGMDGRKDVRPRTAASGRSIKHPPTTTFGSILRKTAPLSSRHCNVTPLSSTSAANITPVVPAVTV